MKKFSPPEMKEVSFPTPHTLHSTPSFKSGDRKFPGEEVSGKKLLIYTKIVSTDRHLPRR